jgi:putative cell wall-binding protein
MRVRTAVGFVAVLAGVVATTLVPASPAQGWTRAPERIAGADRYQTSVDLSNAAFPNGAPAAVVVSGESFPDGLAAGPLAVLLGGPVLLTQADQAPTTVLDELRRLAPTEVLIVGGPVAVSDAAATAVADATGLEPERISGANRYETAAMVAARFPSGGEVAYAASGADFPDALAAGAAAAAAGAPLLLVGPTGAPPVATSALSTLQPAEVRVAGGASAVNDDALGDIQAIVADTRRIAGPDRYATAQELAATFTESGEKPTEALLATGASFPDALAAAPLAAARKAPIVLTAQPCAPQATVDVLSDLSWPDVTVIGGAAVVSSDAANVVPCSPVPDGLIAPGLLLTTQVLPGPRIVHLLTIDRSQGYDIRVVPTTGRVNGTLQPTRLGRELLSLVSVNGDFFDAKGEPTHALAEGGRLLRWPGSLVNSLVGLDPARPTYSYMGKQQGGAEVDLGSSETPLPLGLVNMRAPADEELAMLTPEWTRTFPAGTWCRAVLSPTGKPYIEEDGIDRTIQPATVASAGCSAEPIPRTSDVLVAAPDSEIGAQLADLEPGSMANVRWKLHPEAEGVLDVVGANIMLVTDGERAADLAGSSPFLGPREARTAIAQRANGQVLIAIVDKQPNWSIGMTPGQLADHLLSMGAVEAANLDGGGSSALAVRGVLANRPSDGVERAVNTSLVVVPHGTAVEPTRQ